MFKNLFRRAPEPRSRGGIRLRLEFSRFEPDQSAVKLRWNATGAPLDVLLVFDFRGQPSGVITGFMWDGAQDTLDNMFVLKDDSAFEIADGWAYSDVAQDGTGAVGHAWRIKNTEHATLGFSQGAVVMVDLEHAPDQRVIRTP